MLRQKNGLLTPTSNKTNKSDKTAAKGHTVKMEKAPLSSSPKLAAQAIQPKKSKSSSPSKEDKIVSSEATLIPIKSKKELETKTNEVSPAKKDKVSKVTTSARRASSRIKPTGS